ncbi:MAG: primosomal protein N', partial [Lachnospiraceae bacterium]|nr:primosomal protein N' [Lachnospiraceae bacterium]
MRFADVIVDISHEDLDRTFQYRIPEEFEKDAQIGAPVVIPFGAGNRQIKGYIVGVSEEPKIDPARIKPLVSVSKKGLAIESRIIELAEIMRRMYGGTLNDALKTVSPVKQKIKPQVSKTVVLTDEKAARYFLEEALRRNYKAKARLLEELLRSGRIEYEILVNKLNIARKTIEDYKDNGVLEIQETRLYRGSRSTSPGEAKVELNAEQRAAVDTVTADIDAGKRGVYLLKGVTGSGKTEVYMSVIEAVVARGEQVIMLIPEIALTYQTVRRFSARFGERVSFMHSRLSDGEKYDQYLRAKNGDTDIMIGPRSALFTPFMKIGLIIIDEEHENSYKSENVPKYHTRELAAEYAKILGATLILGSATPSLESYYRAQKGEYKLLELTKRAGNAALPKVHIVDMRDEMKKGNMSMFSRKLRALIEDRLEKKQQIMLFINRRGYAGFVSCRACGEALRCPHCAVSLTAHMAGKQVGRLVCHYCGYETEMPKLCPKCGSKYIAAFGTGTQKVEEYVRREFPNARVLRMDADTTRDKQGHERVLAAFSNDEADILVGTQMIVKGHDFARVTLMGIIAADLSLNATDFRAGERTFELLAQAAGRSGRAGTDGEVVIQTYNPDHYAVKAAA